jgi:hypothetical protein
MIKCIIYVYDSRVSTWFGDDARKMKKYLEDAVQIASKHGLRIQEPIFGTTKIEVNTPSRKKRR